MLTHSRGWVAHTAKPSTISTFQAKRLSYVKAGASILGSVYMAKSYSLKSADGGGLGSMRDPTSAVSQHRLGAYGGGFR